MDFHFGGFICSKHLGNPYNSVQFECLIYTAIWLQKWERQQVILRYNPSNIITLLVYSVEKNNQPSVFLGTVKARDLEEERLSLKEWREQKQKIRASGKAIDQSSILLERLAINQFAVEKIKTLKQRRIAEQKRINRKSTITKVIELFPENSSLKDTAAVSEMLIEATESFGKDTPCQVSLQQQQCTKPIKTVAYDWNQLMQDNW